MYDFKYATNREGLNTTGVDWDGNNKMITPKYYIHAV